VSFKHLGYVAELEIEPGPKLVLLALGNRACQVCGLAWPGMDYLIRKTGMGETAITASLKRALRDGYLRVHRYSKGGRGRTTEYVVCPAIFDFAPAPCGDCLERMKTPRHAGGLGSDKPPVSRGVSEGVIHKPPVSRAGNPPPRDHHSVIETIFSQSEDPSPPARGGLSPASDPNPPRTAEDAAAGAEEFMRELTGAAPNDEHLRHPRKP
jgi:hypothetical protein